MATEAKSRAEAKACCAVRYFTGKPCKHGHIADRYTTTGQCSACVAESKKRFESASVSATAKAGKARRNKRWGDKNKARKAENGRAWRARRPDSVRAHVMGRRALRASATPLWYGELDALVVLEASDLAERRREATGFQWHVDHMIPLRAKTVTGLHVAENLQVIPASINVAKGNKLRLTEPLEWLREI